MEGRSVNGLWVAEVLSCRIQSFDGRVIQDDGFPFRGFDFDIFESYLFGVPNCQAGRRRNMNTFEGEIGNDAFGKANDKTGALRAGRVKFGNAEVAINRRFGSDRLGGVVFGIFGIVAGDVAVGDIFDKTSAPAIGSAEAPTGEETKG